MPTPTLTPLPPVSPAPTEMFQPASVASTTTPPLSPAEEREALVALYEAAGGSGWNNKENWLSSANVGEWYGVTTDAKGRVTKLELSGNNLRGEIPSELGNLVNLTELDLGGNLLSGPMPSELGNLSSLTRLDVSWNDLTNEIPPELGNLAELRELDLGGYQFSGTIPPELGRLANMEVLRIYSTHVEGEIPPELGNLTNLEALHIGGNELTGEIPPELGNLTKLKELLIRKNRLYGKIPPGLGGLANLEVLDLFDNELRGSIPPELGELTHLKALNLGVNRLSGKIPPELGNLTNLEELRLHFNQLTGEIPPELGGLIHLQRMDLGRNRLTGPIPPELGKLESVVEINIVVNRLSGEIPLELGYLARVEVLKLSGNRLTGEIPPELGNLNRLVEMGVSGNELSGCIPTSLEIHYYLAEETSLSFCDPSSFPAGDASEQEVADFLGPNTSYIDPALVSLLYAHLAGEEAPETVRLYISAHMDMSLEPALEAHMRDGGGQPVDDEQSWLLPIELVPSIICRPDVDYVAMRELFGTPSSEKRSESYPNLNETLIDVATAHQGGMPENQAALYALFVWGNTVTVFVDVPDAETEDSVRDWLARHNIYSPPNHSGVSQGVAVLLPVSRILPLARQFPNVYLQAESFRGQGLPMLRSQWPPETLHLEKTVTQKFLDPDSDPGEDVLGKDIAPCSPVE